MEGEFILFFNEKSAENVLFDTSTKVKYQTYFKDKYFGLYKDKPFSNAKFKILLNYAIF